MRIALAQHAQGPHERTIEDLRRAGVNARVVERPADILGKELANIEAAAVDVELLDRPWHDALSKWRGAGCLIPIIFLFPAGFELALASDYSLGLYDFLAKPFRVEELATRLGLILRATNPANVHLLRNGDLTVNTATREVVLAEGPVELTAFEFKLLVFLMLREGRVVSRVELAERFSHGGTASASNTIEVYISRLRRKIGASRIRTLKGSGYRFG